MPRKPSVWLREQDGWYYTTFHGEQVKLSSDPGEAERAFHTLHANSAPKEETGYRPTFRKLADRYLDYTEQTKSPLTYTHQRYFLQSFCDHVKRKLAAELRPLDVTEWVLKHKDQWGHNTQVTARGLVAACLNSAVEQGYLPYSPLAKIKAGTFHRRERILTQEERRRVKEAAVGSNFKNLLTFLEQTGARPYSEAAQVTAAMIDWQEGSITFEEHKNARKGKRRVIYLTPELLMMLRQLAEKKPDGPLFVTRYGIPYNNSNIGQRLRRLEKKLCIPRFNLYNYRHTYITEALERGLSSDIVAELVGNTPKTIAKYYSHLESKRNTLRDAARRAVG
jgi:integrase